MLTRWYLYLLVLVFNQQTIAEEVELDGMSVIGNSELPKSLIIVPWHEAEAAAVPERPLNTLIKQSLEPVDPDVFRRELQYFDTVHNNH
jgi:hypothetical protein